MQGSLRIGQGLWKQIGPCFTSLLPFGLLIVKLLYAPFLSFILLNWELMCRSMRSTKETMSESITSSMSFVKLNFGGCSLGK